MYLEYTAARSNFSSGTAAVDIFTIGTNSTVPLIVDEVRLTSKSTTDVRQVIRMVRRTSAPTGGTSVTPKPTNPRLSVNAQCTVLSIPTAVGSLDYAHEVELWSMLIPYHRANLNIYVPVSSWFCLNFEVAPSAGVDMSFVVRFREL